MSNHPAPTPAPPLWRAPRRWPGADTAHRGADMCRAALGLPPRHTLPVETPPEDDDD
jgi:hypothetical protein